MLLRYLTLKSLKVLLVAFILLLSREATNSFADITANISDSENLPSTWNIVAPPIEDGKDRAYIEMQLQELKNKGVNTSDLNGNTPLILSARLGNPELVQELIHSGANVNASNKMGLTPLMYAVYFDKGGESANLLIDAGAEINTADTEGWTPLMFAILGEKPLSFLQEMLNKGAYAEKRTKTGISPMMVACRFTDDPAVIELLYNSGAETLIADKKGNFPLHYAAMNISRAASDIVRKLIKLRADPNSKNVSGWTPLMFAALFNPSSEVSQVLINEGSQVNVQKEDGITALMLASCNATSGAIDNMKVLIANGADINMQDQNGRQLRDVAIRGGHSSKVIKFIDETLYRSSIDSHRLTSFTAPYAWNILNLARDAAAIGKLKTFKVDDNNTTNVEQIPDINNKEHTLTDYSVIKESEEGFQTAGSVNSSTVATDVTISEIPDENLKNEFTPSASDSPLKENTKPSKKFETIPANERTDSLLLETFEQSAALLTVNFDKKSYDSTPVPNDFKMRRPSTVEGSSAIIMKSVQDGSKLISIPALTEAQIRADANISRGKKARAIAKTNRAKKNDALLVTPLMLAATNENDEVADIINYLILEGEDIEAKDGEGRTPLACAIRYNARPLAAMALIKAGANTNVKVNGNSLKKLIRFNDRISHEDRDLILSLLRN